MESGPTPAPMELEPTPTAVTPEPTPTAVTPEPTPTAALAGPEGLSSYWHPNVKRWEHLITMHATQWDVDPDLVAAIMTVESSGRPDAISHAGAVGLMQVMPRETGFPGRPTHNALLDPDFNIKWGLRILASELEWANGDLVLALGAYYDGRARAAAGWQRTRAYAQKVLSLYWAATE